MVVYKITNTLNGKEYIGQTIQKPSIRWKQHCNSKNAGKSYIHNSIQKHGSENFTFEVLFEAFDIDALNEAEMVIIEDNNSLHPLGYNLHTGGNNHIVSDITRQRLSEAGKGRLHTQAAKDKVRDAKLGVKRTEEVKLKVSIGKGARPFNVYNKKDNTFIGTWINKAKCAKDLGLKYQCVGKCLLGKRKSSKGFIFKYGEINE